MKKPAAPLKKLIGTERIGGAGYRQYDGEWALPNTHGAASGARKPVPADLISR